MFGRVGATLLAIGAMLAACAGLPGSAQSPPQTSAAVAAKNPLAGTEWRLVSFQSMDDAIGTKKPEAPDQYTMRLNADGTVQMRLNCNRAIGSWSADPGSEGTTGHFEFGPLAMTRALCPPPSLDEQIAAHAQYVRSYLLRDGKLYLSLMADGGIYAWEPVAGPRPAAEE